MKASFVSGLAAVALGLSAAGGALAAPQEAATAQAPVESARTVQVLVPQGEIKSNIVGSNVEAAAGGGLLGALIDAGIESERAKKAEAAIQPLRAALTGYDVDALAVQATKGVVEKLQWPQAASEGFGRDNSVLGKSAMLDASATPQIAFFEYTYDLTPDFSNIRVVVNLQVANKAAPAGKKPEARLQYRYLADAQSFTSVVSLPSPSKDIAENAARWSADDGKLARQALADAFQDVVELAPRALTLTKTDWKAQYAKDKKRVVMAGYAGPLQEEGPSGSLLVYLRSLVHVRTLAE